MDLCAVRHQHWRVGIQRKLKNPKSHDFRHNESEQVHQLYNQGHGLLRILHRIHHNVMGRERVGMYTRMQRRQRRTKRRVRE